MDRQTTFATLDYQSRNKKTRQQRFLEKMERIIPWDRWIKIINKALPKSSAGRHPYPAEMMLRIYLIQIWFNLSDEGTEDAIMDCAPMAYFVGVEHFGCGVPDATTLCRFRNALVERGVQEAIMRDQENCLRDKGLSMSSGTIVDATIIEAPSSTKNKTKSRDPEMHSTKKGDQWHFGMRDENGDMKVELRVNARRNAMKKKFKDKMFLPLLLEAERALSSVRSKVKHPNHWLKCVCGFCKAVYKGLKKNHARACMIFASMNMWRLPKLLGCRA